jgi:copper oxidase (laccase) domain-containing protein
MRQVLLAQSMQNERYFSADSDGEHFYFDLSGYLEDKLLSLGIKDICNSKIDTYVSENGYFSYRRNTNLDLIKQKFDYPTQLSCLRL